MVVQEGESVQLTLDVIPEDYKNADILWSVDNDQLAQVTDGLVSAKNDGVVTVTAASALDGTVFDTCRVAITAKARLSDQWTVVNPTNALTVAEDQENQITIDTEAGDFTQKNVPKNKLVLEIPQSDFEISVKVNAEMTADFQTAALYVWDDTGALFAAQRRYHSFFGQNDNHHIYAAPNRNDVNSNMAEPWVQANPQDTECYLKVVKKDGVLSAWYSLDGIQWNPIQENVTIPNLNTSETLQVGVFTSNGERNTISVPVTFTDFTLNGEVIPFRGEEDTYVLWTDALENVNADYGTSAQDLNLPEMVTVLLSDGTSKEVAVKWDVSTYDPQTSGAQTLIGTLEELGDVVNTLDVTAQVTVVVGDKPIAADKTLLQKTYGHALTLSTDGVIDSAKKHFNDAVAAVKAVLDDANATQEQVNTAWDNLLEAIWGLGLTQGDKTMLELLIDRADSMTANADKYVQDNWQQLVDALATAKDVLADGDAMQEDVDKAADALLDAILAQRFKADKSILEDLLNKAEGINLDGYTAESVATFRTALANAQAVMADNSLSQDDQATVDAAVAQLTVAMDGLTVGGAPETTDKPETSQKPEATQKPENNVPQTGDTAHMMGYVLSRPQFKLRGFLQWVVFIPMIFTGGMVANYVVTSNILGLNDTIWCLILPLAVSSWNVTISKTFFRTTIPDSIIESAKIDGASQLTIFTRIVVPISKPVFATIALFLTFAYWNDWLQASLYISDSKLVALQPLLNNMMGALDYIANNPTAGLSLQQYRAQMPSESVRMAIAAVIVVPIACAYPFFQKYFISGLTVGAVKG